MAVEDFYNSLQETKGAPFTPFAELTSAEQAHFRGGYTDTIGDNISSLISLQNTSISRWTREVSNAEMLTLRATPLIIVPAVANRILIPVAITVNTAEATTARAGSYDVRLRWQISATVFESCTGDFNRTAMHGSTTSPRSAFVYPTLAGHARALSDFASKPLVVHNEDSAEYTGGSTDNVVTFGVSVFSFGV